MYDLIGDIHGHAEELVQLLEALGYRKTQGVYRHPERKVVFLGDFIDRGPQIRSVLELARPMVEEGAALAILGNHELNALAYHRKTRIRPANICRRRSPKNEKQHRQTLEQLTPQELGFYLEWFRTLPLWLDLAGLRAVHACWDERAMEMIAKVREHQKTITTQFLHSACRKGHPLLRRLRSFSRARKASCRTAFPSRIGRVMFAPNFARAGICLPRAIPIAAMPLRPTKSPAA